MERADHISRQLGCALGLSFILGLFASTAGAGITIDLVTVGDAGNVGELSGDGNGGYGPPRVCGAVPYVYQIGTYEVTNAQYRQFLNSVARYGDSYGLYSYLSSCGNTLPHDFQGIVRTGSGTGPDPYVYISRDNDPNWDNKPANYVSWYSSLRFINWLQNAQPTAEAGPGVTETGTYTIGDPSTVVDPYGHSTIQYPVTIPDHASLTTPHYVLPTEDEWYKGAYYKGGGTAAGYWDYATQSNTLPNNNPPDLDTGNSANYYFIDLVDPNNTRYAVGDPYCMTDVGAYTLSDSAYGTYDQNGNLFELLEDPSPYGVPAREIRGGSWNYYQQGLPAYARDYDAEPGDSASGEGFRVAVVPEPSALGLIFIVGLGALRRRG